MTNTSPKKVIGVKLLSVGLLITAFVFGSNGIYIYAKAYFAEYLIAQAWQNTLDLREPQKPWHWADTWPVARLEFPSKNTSLIVLAGAHGSALAFGPGQLDGTVKFSQQGTKIVAGHRDTHFSLLEDIRLGELIRAQDELGNWKNYQVSHIDVIDSRKHEWHYQKELSEIHLITCFPFNTIVPGGPLRLVVVAEPLSF